MLILALGAIVLDAGRVPARADYKLHPGDTLALTIVGMPDLATRAMVDADGMASFPLAGDLAVAGLSVADVKAKLQAIFPTKELMTHLADGRQVPAIIAPVQVSLAISEYRPIYVDGDVAKPGAVTFRPGLMVRQALALAGGLGQSRTKADDPMAQTLDLTGKYNDLTVTIATTQVRIARLQGELDGSREIDPRLVGDLPIASKLRDDMLAVEQQLMTTRLADVTKEKSYLASASRHELQRAVILDQQETKDNEGVKIDEADLQRLEDLFKKGAVALPTLSEARRAALQSSTRALQTSASLASVQREQGELDRRLEKVDDVRRAEILLELSAAKAKLAAARTESQAVNSKLRYAGMLKPQVAPGLPRVQIAIVRSVDGHPTTIEADLDTHLEPGDAVQVTQPIESSGVGQ